VPSASSSDLDTRPEYPDLARLGASLRRWWPAMLVGAVLFGALGVHASRPDATPYTASSQVLVGPLAGELSVLRAAGQQAQTYADLATSRPVLSAALKGSGSRQTVAQLENNVTAKADDVTRLLKISVNAHKPTEAAHLANAVAAQVVRQTRVQQPPAAPAKAGKTPGPAELAAGLKLQIVDFAEPGPASASGSTSKSLAAIAALAGLLVALAIGVVVDVLQRRVDTLAELEAAAPVPPIGVLRGGRIDARTAALARPRAGVLVADPGSGGADRLALALAEDLTADGVPVLLVDADPSATLSERLDLTGREVVPTAGAPDGDLRALAVERGPGLFVVPRRALPRGAAHADAEARAAAARDRAAGFGAAQAPRAEALVLSAGPAAAVAGLGSLADEVQGAVLAVRRGATKAPEVSEAVTLLQRYGVPVLGTVLLDRRGGGPLRRRRARRAARARPRPRAATAPDAPEHQPA
jgi:capsular polysaccharide biosynthesis protein